MLVRRTVLTHSAVALAAVAAVSLLGLGRAAEQPDHDPARMQEAMAKWMESIKVSKGHDFLKQFTGEWTTKTSMYMNGADAPPMTTEGAAKLELIHGGRFIKQDVSGQMPAFEPGGKPTPFTGLGLTGFDNVRQLYSMVWTDSMCTGVMTGSGNLSRDGKTLTCFGTMDEPMTGEIGKMVRYTTRSVDGDKFIFEIAEVLYGDPFTVVKIEYTRKK